MHLWCDSGKIGGLAGFGAAGFRLKPIHPDFIKGNVHKEKSVFFRIRIRLVYFRRDGLICLPACLFTTKIMAACVRWVGLGDRLPGSDASACGLGCGCVGFGCWGFVDVGCSGVAGQKDVLQFGERIPHFGRDVIPRCHSPFSAALYVNFLAQSVNIPCAVAWSQIRQKTRFR